MLDGTKHMVMGVCKEGLLFALEVLVVEHMSTSKRSTSEFEPPEPSLAVVGTLPPPDQKKKEDPFF